MSLNTDGSNVVTFQHPAQVPTAEADSAKGDRARIQQTANRVKAHQAKLNGAAIAIEIGNEFSLLHAVLKKNEKDKTRVGWVRAFSEAENQFGRTRQCAESYVKISTAFGGASMLAPSLPQSWRALLALARLKLTNKLTDDKLAQLIAEGRIKPDSTEARIRQLGIELGLISSPKKRDAAPEPTLLEHYRAANKAEQTTLLQALPVHELIPKLTAAQNQALKDRYFGAKNGAAAITGRKVEKLIRSNAEIKALLQEEQIVPGTMKVWFEKPE